MWNCWSKIASSLWSGFFQTSYVKARHYFHLKFCFFLRCILGSTIGTHGESKFSGCHYKIKGLPQDILIVLKYFGMLVAFWMCCIKCTIVTMRSFHLCSRILKDSIFLRVNWFSGMIIIDSYYFRGLGFTTIKMCTLKSCSIIFNNILMDWIIQNWCPQFEVEFGTKLA